MKAQRKARQARIRLVRTATSNAFVAAKSRQEQNLDGTGVSSDKNSVNPFELQHHHLLRCLELTTVCRKRRTPFRKFHFSFYCFCFKDREFVETSPNMLIGGGVVETSHTLGSGTLTGLRRLGSPSSRFLLNPRKWWCGNFRRQRRNSYKFNIVSLNCSNHMIYIYASIDPFNTNKQ